MRILSFANYFPPHIGAASTYNYQIIDYLAKKGHKILVFARGDQIPKYKNRKFIVDFHPNIKVIYSNPKIKHPYSSFLSHLENFYVFYKKYRGSFKPDLVLSQYHTFHFAPIVGALTAKLLGIPHVVRSHDIFSPYYGKYREQATLFELLYLKIANRLTFNSIKYTNLFYVTAREQIIHLRKFKKFKNTTFKLHHNGLLKDEFIPNPNNELKKKYNADYLILYIGMLDIDLGIQEVIESLDLVNQQIPNTHFIIVGSGKDEDLIRDLIKRKNLDDLVHLIPPVPHSDIPYYINNVDIGIGFLAQDLFYRYCVPVKCLEYMACGKTFITTPVSEDVIKNSDTGLMIDNLNSNQISEKIITLLKDREMRKRFGKKGREKIDLDFNWEKIMREFETDIINLVENV